ncbi:MAG: enoyl-CoA hydratase-related protein [Thermocrispum sp.]
MLDLENRDRVAIVHLRRCGPNQLSVELWHRIAAALRFVQRSDGIVLTGHDETFAVDAQHEDPDELLVARYAALRAVRTHPRPVVAAVNGDALGAGFDLATAADVRLMSGGVIGTTRTVSLTARAAAQIGLVELPTRTSRLLDEAVGRARSLLSESR